MTIADHDLISQRYFFPRHTPPPSPTMVDVGEHEVACATSHEDHSRLVLHFHGNGEVVADYVPRFADALHGLGADAFFAEYRGYGGSTGTPRLGAMLDDVEPIREAIDRPLDEIVVFGRSIGSIYAIEFVDRFPEIAGLVLESGIADVLERILLRASPEELGAKRDAVEEEFGRLFDHERKLGGYHGPTLVMHAAGDHLVDSSHAERNASWCGGDAELLLFERGDHNSIFHANQAQYLSALGSFLDDLD